MFESMQNEEIRGAFQTKISKERIGDEIQSALKLRNQKYYLDLLH
jgi:tRNA nucleotidyltransferase/poly(A) polymerase